MKLLKKMTEKRCPSKLDNKNGSWLKVEETSYRKIRDKKWKDEEVVIESKRQKEKM